MNNFKMIYKILKTLEKALDMLTDPPKMVYRSTEPFHRIDMLSERGMCDSCKSVAKQFEKEHPGVTMNVVSNKKEIGNVWKHRYEKNK